MITTKSRLLAFAATVFLLAPAAFAADPPVTLLSVGPVLLPPSSGNTTEQDLWVGEMMVGTVTVINSDYQLRVTYRTIDPAWQITETNLDMRLQLADIPQAGSLPVVADFFFPYTATAPATSIEYVFKINSDIQDQANFYVAAQAKVQMVVACVGEEDDDPDHHHGDKDGKHGGRLQCDHHEGKGKPCDHHESRLRKRDRGDDREKSSFRSRHNDSGCDHHEGKGKGCDHRERNQGCDGHEGKNKPCDNHESSHKDSGCDHHEGQGKRCDHRERNGGCDGHEGKNKPCDNHEGDSDGDGGPVSCLRMETAWAGDQLFVAGQLPRYFVFRVLIQG